ncbi:MAG: S41 family peptidase, partial [Sphingopyxis sp.]
MHDQIPDLIPRRAMLIGTVAAGCVFVVVTPAGGQSTLSASERQQVVLGVVDLIEQRYVYPDRGCQIAQALRRARGRFDQSDPITFADAMTSFLRDTANDGHFAVEYRPSPPAAESAESAAAQAAAETERYYGITVNHGFEAVQRLDGGIGYLDLRVFAPTTIAADMASAAMTLLAQSPALVIDLRRNGGGYSEMVALLAAYLFDQPVELSGIFDRPSGRHTRSFTPPTVSGRRFGAAKPVYILQSNRTFSAAEAFAYDLQALRRATIVGDFSGGGAHPFEYRTITPHFILSLPEGRSINP